MNRFTKISATGERLPSEATDHVAVIDSTSNLQWLVPYATKKQVDHAKATAAVAKLDTLGFTDWRLPTRAELLTLVDDTRHNPAIDIDAFPGTKSDWHWTSTPAAWSPADYAWIVNFDLGLCLSFHRNGDACVRAVRSVVPASSQ